MASPSKRRPIWPFLAAVLVLGAVAVVLLLVGAWQVVSPAPQVAELQNSQPKRTRVIAPVEEGPFLVEGVVLLAHGQPAAGVELSWRAPDEKSVVVGVTEDDGTFSVEVDGTGEFAPAIDTRPDVVQVTEDTLGLRFVGMQTCPLEVLALGVDGAPLTDQTVRARVSIEGARHPPKYTAPTNDAGIAHFDDLPCGVASVWLRRSGHPQARRSSVDTVVETRITLQLRPGVRISGRVEDFDGAPIAEARVSSGDASDQTEEDGTYGLIVDPLELSSVRAAAPGYLPSTERLRVDPADREDIVLDFVLESSRQLTVYCAGLPDDSCHGIQPLMCTHTFLPVGDLCSGSPTTCTCPDGAAAVRGGGLSVQVHPDDDEVWLDLRGRGAITGRVVIDGQPASPHLGHCLAIATRIPEGLEDMAGGTSAGAQSTCGTDGRFHLHGVKSGQQVLMVQTFAGSADIAGIYVDGDTVDVGDVEIGGGGRIEGVVLDGATGEGLPGIAVVAWSAKGDELAGMGQGVSGTEGRFIISGLDDGTYSVVLANRPLDEHQVVVKDGRSEPLELTTGEAGLLAENGFALRTDDQGRLEVASVEEGGPAFENGLQEGDRVEGLTLAGIDMTEMFPGASDDITDAVLDKWGGPGVGLVVDRDGERVVVPLD